MTTLSPHNSEHETARVDCHCSADLPELAVVPSAVSVVLPCDPDFALARLQFADLPCIAVYGLDGSMRFAGASFARLFAGRGDTGELPSLLALLQRLPCSAAMVRTASAAASGDVAAMIRSVIDRLFIPQRPTISCTLSVFAAQEEEESRRVLAIGMTLLPPADGDGGNLVVSATDITEDERRFARMQQIAGEYWGFFESAIEGFFRTSPEGRYIKANSALARVYGYDSPLALQEEVSDIGAQLYADSQRRIEFVALLDETDEIFGFESEIIRKDGSRSWISENVRAVRDDNGRLLYYEGSVVDISARKAAESRLQHMALHDALTDLPNRILLLDRVGVRLARARRHNDWSFAILSVDADRFKVVNDSLGHAAGDRVLIEFARRLRGCLRAEDTLARTGGDEFAVMLEDVHTMADVEHVTRRIRDRFSVPFQLDRGAGQFFLGASIGVVIPDLNYREASELLRDADTALFETKMRGRGGETVFEKNMHERARARLSAETDLRLALERDEFIVYYQPLLDVASEQVIGFEALVRWIHPELGMISPVKFIPIAEETGMIGELGEMVLRQGCRQMRAWMDARRARGLGDEPLKLNVNVSPVQLRRADVVDRLMGIITRAGVEPGWISLEITESTILDDPAATLAKLNALKARGVKFAVDDFGTGYSNLAQLHQFPLDTLKIDQSFTRGLRERPDDPIVRAIVNLGRGLGLRLVAEGVESESQRDALRNLGCDVLQGYLFGRPMPADEASRLIGI